MFDKKEKNLTDVLGKTNRIVEGTTIKGDISSLADFRLDGHLVGNFNSKGKIVVGPAGSVTGEIVCENADIEGKFDGKIIVNDLLNLKAKSIIKGQVFCGKLSVEPGVDFNAICEMQNNINNNTDDSKPKSEQK